MTITHPDVLSLTTGIGTVIGAAKWIGVCHPSSADGSPDIGPELGELEEAVEAVSKVEGAPDGLLRNVQRLVDLAGWIPFWSHEESKRRRWSELVEDLLPAWLHLFVGLAVRQQVAGEVNGEAVLTAEEACRYLRLDEGRDMDNAVKALNRLVDNGRLRPCVVGKYRRYSVDELRRFIERETEKSGEVR